MSVTIRYHMIEHWPPLAWVAECCSERRGVSVYHGCRVETRGDWFCEAVWPGDFEAGDFDRHEVVFGSGGRLRERVMTFVSSAATVDRLQLAEKDGALVVSNSLPCLLEYIDADVDPSYSHYYGDFRTVIRGIKEYKSEIGTTQGAVELVYYYNISWNGNGWWIELKKQGDDQFFDYHDYVQYIESVVRGIGINMSANGRRYPYRPLGTISAGYDSPAVATIAAREIGLREVLTFTQARGGEDDSGTAIADCLGLTTIEVDRDAWRAIPGASVPHLACNAYGEDVHYAAAEESLKGRVLFTGHTGDRAWGKEPAGGLNPDLPRGDPVGLSLSEARLWYGALHCPVPFMGIRRIEQLFRITHSEDMQPWDHGGDYSRPIPRRLVEEAGVPRALFGQSKLASAVVLWRRDEAFLPERELDDLRAWISEHEDSWIRQGLRSPLQKKRTEKLLTTLMLPYRPIHSLASRIPGLKPYSARVRQLDPVLKPDPLFTALFPWALAHAKRRYRGEMADF